MTIKDCLLKMISILRYGSDVISENDKSAENDTRNYNQLNTLDAALTVEYERTHLHVGDYSCIDLKHPLLNQTYMLMKINKIKELDFVENVEFEHNGVLGIRFVDQEKSEFRETNRTGCHCYNGKLSISIDEFGFDRKFNEHSNFIDKVDILEFIEFIKEEIKNDVQKIKPFNNYRR